MPCVSELCPMYFNDKEIKTSNLYIYGAESILGGKWITISLIAQWGVLWDKCTQEDDVVQRKGSQLPLGRASLIAPVGKESACNAGDPGLIPGPGGSTGEGIDYPLQYSWASLVAQLVKNPPAMWETWVQSLGWEHPLEKGKATHSTILVCIIHGVTKSRTQLSDFDFQFSTGEVWKGFTQQVKVTDELLRALELMAFAFILKKKKKKKFQTKAEKRFFVVVSTCFRNAHFHSPCQDYVPTPIAHLFVCKCAFRLKMEMLDKLFS